MNVVPRSYGLHLCSALGIHSSNLAWGNYLFVFRTERLNLLLQPGRSGSFLQIKKMAEIFFGENVQYGLPGFEIHVKRLIDRNSLSTVILK